jgi:hypothetical protein
MKGLFNDYVTLNFRRVAKLRKVTISCVISVSPSVCLSVRMEQLCSHMTDFD